jgi:16S rRNA (cytidine1402-2'-O)-methyltransferase
MKRKLTLMSEIEAVHAMYVAPHDLVKQLTCIGQIFGQGTTIVLARELTKVYEEFWRGTLEEALEEFTLTRQPKGEFTLLVENYRKDSGEIGEQSGEEDHSAVMAVDGKVEKILRSLIASGTPASEAVRLVCSVSQQPLKKKHVYNAAMKLKQEQPPPV